VSAIAHPAPPGDVATAPQVPRLTRLLVTLAPYLWLLVFFLVPFAIVLKISLSTAALAQPPYEPSFGIGDGAAAWLGKLRQFSLDNYAFLATDALYIRAYLSSLGIALLSTLLTLLVGYPIAYGMARAPRAWQPTLVMLVILPFWTSFLIRVYAWIGILKKEGLLNQLLLSTGLISEPLTILDTNWAVYVGIVYSYLPFLVLPLYAALEKLDESLLEAAADLGCPPVRAFWRITFPLSLPGVIAGCLLVFIPVTGEFVIPDLLGGSGTLMIGKTLWAEFFNTATGRSPRRSPWSSSSSWWCRSSSSRARSSGGRSATDDGPVARDGAMRRTSVFNVTAVAAGLAFLYLPIVILIIVSFNASRLVTVWGGFSTRWYAALLDDGPLLDAAWVTVRVALLSTTVATVLGTLAAIALVRFGRFRGRTLFSGMVYAPLVMPEVITGLSMLLLFVAIGFDRGFWTLVLAHITFSLSFVTVVVQSRLVSFDRSLEEAAMDLGCPPVRTFLVITLPIIAPAVAAGWMLGLTLSLDDLVISSFTTGPGATTLPMKIYSQVRLGVTPEINAASTILVAIVAVGVIAASLLSKRREVERRRAEQLARATP
jgi:putrescine transport system permease protein